MVFRALDHRLGREGVGTYLSTILFFLLDNIIQLQYILINWLSLVWYTRCSVLYVFVDSLFDQDSRTKRDDVSLVEL